LAGPFVGPSWAVSKVLEVEPEIVHLRLYTNAFETCPTNVNLDALSWKIGDVPMAKSGFFELNRRLIGHAALSAEETDAVRETKYFMKMVPKP
jgi:hypothetical protein